MANALRAKRVKIRTNSQLVSNHLNENFQTRDEKMKLYLRKAKQMVKMFQEVEIQQIS